VRWESRDVKRAQILAIDSLQGREGGIVEFEGLDRYNSVSKCLSYTYSVFAQNFNHIL
jgi:hypothetical protein